MYAEKGLIKVFNGKKFKFVSYHNKNGLITFATSAKSHKYAEIKKTKRIKVRISDHDNKYPASIIENPILVDQIFADLKKNKTIPFFIPRKNKIIVQYHY